MKNPEHWSTRKKTRFLFLPVTIGSERKWLKFATWIERYKGVPSTPYEDCFYWFKESWV